RTLLRSHQRAQFTFMAISPYDQCRADLQFGLYAWNDLSACFGQIVPATVRQTFPRQSSLGARSTEVSDPYDNRQGYRKRSTQPYMDYAIRSGGLDLGGSAGGIFNHARDSLGGIGDSCSVAVRSSCGDCQPPAISSGSCG